MAGAARSESHAVGLPTAGAGAARLWDGAMGRITQPAARAAAIRAMRRTDETMMELTSHGQDGACEARWVEHGTPAWNRRGPENS